MNLEVKSFSLSLVIHLSVVAVYLFYFYTPMVLKSEEIKTVTIDLIEEQKEIVTPKKEVIVQKKRIEKQKVIEKKPEPKPIVKKIVKKEPIKPKVEVKQKPIVKKVIEKPKVIQKQIVQKAVSKKPVKNFVKTNFEIIRDKVLSHVVYPKKARRMKYTGVVHLALIIGTDGLIKDIKIKKSSGKSSLDKAALKAAQKLKNEVLPKPQKISTVVLPVSFQLKS